MFKTQTKINWLYTKMFFVVGIFLFFTAVLFPTQTLAQQECNPNEPNCPFGYYCNSDNNLCEVDPQICNFRDPQCQSSEYFCNQNSGQCEIKPITPSYPSGPGAPNGTFCQNPGQIDPECASGFCGPNQVCEQETTLCGGIVCSPGYYCNTLNQVCVPVGPSLPIPSYPGPYPAGSGPAFCGGDPNLVLVDGVCLPKEQACSNGSIICTSNLTDLIVKIIKILLGLAGIIGVLILIIGGYWYMASAGNEETAEKGRKTIVNAIIGLVVIILSYAIVSIITNTVGG